VTDQPDGFVLLVTLVEYNQGGGGDRRRIRQRLALFFDTETEFEQILAAFRDCA
jgi:hypothetical protein